MPRSANLRSSLDIPAGSHINEEEVPLVPLQSKHQGSSSSGNRSGKATQVHYDNGNNDDDDEVEGWELDDFNSTHSRDLDDPSSYDLATATRLTSNGRVRLQDEEKDTPRKMGTSEDDDDGSALAMVKAVVPETDDPSLPNVTFRVLLLGSILCAIGAAISQLFFFKSNAPSFSGFLIILLSYPAGHWLAQVLPTRSYQVAGYSFTLNPGPFNVKEHLLIAVLAGSGSGAAYGADIITIQDLYYKQDIGPVGGVLLLLSTQLLGFGLSGLVYNLLVRPSKMVWPSTLVPISLFNTLHGTEKDKEKLTKMRLRLFKVAFLAIFAWQFMPSVVAPVLTSFATLCILSPESVLPTARILGSGYSGYGILNLSFDWAVIGSAGGLYIPWFASLNRFVGFGTMMWIIAPMLYFSNFWSSLSFDSPIGPQLYNKAFDKFDISAVIDAETLTLDIAKWEAHKPLLLTPYFAITYGVSFSVLTAAVVTVLLWHHNDIIGGFATRRTGKLAPPDVHVQMMEASYDPVPGSWYAYIGGSMLVAAIYVVTFYPMQLPIWGLLLSLLVSLVFLPACGIIAATTGTVIGLNVITELVAGFLLPGEPIANVTFKAFGYISMAQALALVADLKLGLYCKIKPKAMFLCQAYGTALGAIVNYIYVRSVINSKRPYLDGTLEDPTGQWTGRAPRIFYSASVIWGLVGPARFFDGNYRVLYMGFLIGAVLPLIPWFLSKRYPKVKWLPKVSIPLILSGMMSAPEIPTNVLVSGFISAWLSQRWALKKYPEWYEKYNFVLSAALDAGTSIQALVLYVFGLGEFLEWWGNSKIDSEHCRVAQ